MARLIDADGLKKSIEEDEELKDNSLAYLLMNLMTCYIDDSITVDAVEVVRCKDCKNMLVSDKWVRFCNVLCKVDGLSENGYCNYGERRKDEP